MVSQFSNHSAIGKASLIIGLLTIIFFVLSIVIVVVSLALMNPFLSIFSSIFSFLVFIFSILSIVFGAIAFWGKDRDKYGLFAFIVGLIFIILIFISIAISATLYVYVSGMIGSNGHETTPSLFFNVDPGTEDSSNEAIVTIWTISEEDVEWYDVSYSLIDITDSDSLVEGVDYNTNIIDLNENSFIDGDDKIEIIGLGGELESDHEYRFNIVYGPTGSAMGTMTWDQ